MAYARPRLTNHPKGREQTMATVDQTAKVIKKLGTADKLPSVPAVAREMKEDLNGAFVTLVYQAEPVAFPELKISGNKSGVEKGRKSGLRFERIAARSGLTLAQVKEFAEAAGVADLYTGRGRRGGSSGAATGTSGRRGTAASKEKPAGRGTSNRRSSAKKDAPAATPAKAGRRGTRASAADPK